MIDKLLSLQDSHTKMCVHFFSLPCMLNVMPFHLCLCIKIMNLLIVQSKIFVSLFFVTHKSQNKFERRVKNVQ